MSDVSIAPPSRFAQFLRDLWGKQRVWLLSALTLAGLAIFAPAQGAESLGFTADALLHTGPYLILSIAIAAWAGATGADALIAKAFTGSPLVMIFFAALAGGLSPFCSCGVIPLVAALLAMGVPLSAVMAFWLASPIMDPSMFVLTAGVLGTEFAIAKTLAAVGLGVAGGLAVLALGRAGALADPLRPDIGNGGCGAGAVRGTKTIVWRFWEDDGRRAKFMKEALSTTLFLGKWLTLAFILESLMLAYTPADLVARTLGGEGFAPIAVASLVGVPAYLNGYAALPLVGGLIEQGMAPGAGLAFLVAGGVTSLPAAIAVWALAKPRVFGLYIALSLSGAFSIGVLFQLWSA